MTLRRNWEKSRKMGKAASEHGSKINNNKISKNTGKQPRMANLEGLRCVAMMMVVVLHFLGKGDLLGVETAESMGAVGVAAWVLEAFCIVAVNVYMLISGYFLSESSFKLSRLIALYFQVWLYSVGVGFLSVALGIVPEAEVDTHFFLTLLFPVSMRHYWFTTAYLFLYLLLPFLGFAVKRLTKQQLKLGLIILLAVFCGLKSVLPFRLEEDGQGYTCLWYVCVFLVAAYIRRFGVPFLEKKWRCACLYVSGCLAVFLEFMLLRQVFLRTGSMELILKVSYDYNHVFPLLASVGLFGLFLQAGAKGRFGKTVEKAAVKVAPFVLGVYLLHENMGVRYVWPKLFGADRIRTVGQLLLGTAAAVICVFITGVIIEWIRCGVIKGLHNLLLHLKGYRWLADGVERLDERFRKQQP